MKKRLSMWSSFGSAVQLKKRKVEIIVDDKKEEIEDIKFERKEVVDSPQPSPTSHPTPKQDELRATVTLLTSEISALKTLLAGSNPLMEHRVKLAAVVRKQEKCMAELKRLQSLVKASRKHRREQAKILRTINKFPRPAPGRPPLEDREEYKELPD